MRITPLLSRLYRRVRRLAAPVHPRRLWFYVRHGANLLGMSRLRAALRSFLIVVDPRRLAATLRWAGELTAAARRRRREPRLTVAVDVTVFWEPLTGIGWYLYRLLEHLADRDDLRLRLYGPNLIDTPDLPQPVVELPVGDAIELLRHRVPEGLSVESGRLARWLRAGSSRLIAADRNELLFAPNYFLPPCFDRCRGRLVVTVHDLSFQRVPWTMKEATRRDHATHLRRTMERAAKVLTDSETVLGELVAGALVEESRIHAVPLGPGPAAAGEGALLPAAVPERYVLYVGTLEPRKNVPTLLAAWRLLRDRGAQPPPLVLCGGFGWKTEALRREVAAAEAEGWLRRLGYLEEAQVTELYRHALLVALPSIYEGFGLPVVEAMSVGVPLVLSDIPVLREVGGDAAVYVPPQEPAAWADAMEELFGDGEVRAELARRGRDRSRRFSWQRTAADTAAVWIEAAGRGVPAAGGDEVRK
ncbi:MAG: glycosyltransferase family 4 protein [bacterium]|nr:glycosyltransferase family 4 protein [bacterium]